MVLVVMLDNPRLTEHDMGRKEKNICFELAITISM